MRIKSLLCVIWVGFVSLFSLKAQNFLGFQTGNHAGVYGVHFQPASVADNRFIFDVNLNGLVSTYQNNYVSMTGNTPPTTQTWDDRKLYYVNPKGKNRNYRYDELTVTHPLSFMLTTSRKSGIAFVWRTRQIQNLDRLNGDMLESSLRKNANPLFWNRPIDASKSQYSEGFYDEYAFTYGRVLKDSGEHFLKMGATVKLIQSFSGGYLYANSLDVTYKNDTTLAINSADVDFGAGLNADTVSIPLLLMGRKQWFNGLKQHLSLLDNGTFVRGFGTDIGFVYEYRPDYKDYCFQCDGKYATMRFEDKYKLKIGASLTDIGFFTLTKRTQIVNFAGSNVDSTHFPFETKGNLGGMLSHFAQNLNTKQDTTTNIRLWLPSAISVMADYKINHKFSIGAVYYGAFKFRNSARALHALSNFSIIPRYNLLKTKRIAGKDIHTQYGEMSFPISIDQNFEPQIGMGIRMNVPYFPIQVMIGSNTSAGAILKKRVRATNNYIAISMPLAFRNNDKDFDCVRNRKDKCVETPGLKKFAGCPDTDGDLVPDNLDECVLVPGKVNLNGCPDRDDDRIPDSKDNCPDVKGIAKYNGCPDTDNDQVPDPEDDCPTVKGKKELRGCPDSDNDQVPDKDDECPKDKGKKELKGCPDTDNDTVADKDDKCPKEKGSPSAGGCPDTDNDTVADKDDKCPKEAGSPVAGGCPDADGDLIPDKEDKCPNDVGTKADKGCPTEMSNTPNVPSPNNPNPNGSNPNGNTPPNKTTDTDGDGTPDKDDKCPTQYGTNVGCPEKSTVPEFVQRAFDEVEFDTDKSDIRPQYFDLLDGLAFYLKLNPDLRLILRGNTDSDADESYNEALGKRRAEAVRQYLILHDVPANRLKIESYGERKPKSTNETPEGKQRNRRVEVSIWE